MELEYPHEDLSRGPESQRKRFDLLLTDLSEQKDQLAYLDRSPRHKNEDLYDTGRALGYMEPAKILEHFQPEVLVWAAAGAGHTDDLRRMNQGLELLGFDAEMFERARVWEWEENHNSFGTNALNQYSVFDAFQGKMLKNIELDEYLANHARSGVEISPARANAYSLEPLRINMDESPDRYSTTGWEQTYGRYRDGKIFGMYLDTPSGFALMYKDKPQAVVAVAAEGEDAVAIHQLQGFRGSIMDSSKPEEDSERLISSRGLAVLEWRGLMVDLTANVAGQLGKTKIIIKSGRNNRWTKPEEPSQEPRMTVEQAVAAYDKNAELLGFDQRPNGDWQLPIAS